VTEERGKSIDKQGQTGTITDTRMATDHEGSVTVDEGPCQSLASACLAANGVLSLLNLTCYLLDRQVERLAKDFEREGGFTERLYRVRSAKRRNKS
jgi:four helix bundle suffix protein